MSGMKIVAGGAALVALAAGAFFADRTLGEHGSEALADPAPAADAATRPVPPITLPNLDEQPTSLSDFQGQPLLVNFWATWCRPCRKEIPLLIELRAAHAAERLEIVGIAIDELEVTREMASAFEIDYPIIVGEQEGIDAMVAFGAPTTALPFTAAVDKDGQIVGGHVGELTPEDAERLLQLIL